MPAFDMKNAILKIQDGTPSTPKSLTVKFGEGNFTYSEKFNREYLKDRGKIDQVRNGEEEPVEVSIDARWEFLTASTGDNPTIEDVLKQRGEAADWVSVDTDTCAPYAVKLVFIYTPICTADDIETVTLDQFRVESIDHDPKGATLSIKGKANVREATITRTAQD